MFHINLVYSIIFKKHIISIQQTEKVHSPCTLVPSVFFYIKEYPPLQGLSSEESILNYTSYQLQYRCINFAVITYSNIITFFIEK
jgi:hypothetical protein